MLTAVCNEVRIPTSYTLYPIVLSTLTHGTHILKDLRQRERARHSALQRFASAAGGGIRGFSGFSFIFRWPVLGFGVAWLYNVWIYKGFRGSGWGITGAWLTGSRKPFRGEYPLQGFLRRPARGLLVVIIGLGFRV